MALGRCGCSVTTTARTLGESTLTSPAVWAERVTTAISGSSFMHETLSSPADFRKAAGDYRMKWSLTLMLGVLGVASAADDDFFVYFGGYTAGASKGIHAYRFQPASGRLT